MIDLSEVLRERDRTEESLWTFSKEAVKRGKETFPVLERDKVHVTLKNEGGRKLLISLTTRVGVRIPCDRCLSPVTVEIPVQADRSLAIEEKRVVLTSDEGPIRYIDGNAFDPDELILDELLLNWPTKVLCREDCKGLCPVCGQNLNERDCGHRTDGLDLPDNPLRAALRSLKEV